MSSALLSPCRHLQASVSLRSSFAGTVFPTELLEAEAVLLSAENHSSFRSSTSVPALLHALTPMVAAACARATLLRLPGNETDQLLLHRMAQEVVDSLAAAAEPTMRPREPHAYQYPALLALAASASSDGASLCDAHRGDHSSCSSMHAGASIQAMQPTDSDMDSSRGTAGSSQSLPLQLQHMGVGRQGSAGSGSRDAAMADMTLPVPLVPLYHALSAPFLPAPLEGACSDLPAVLSGLQARGNKVVNMRHRRGDSSSTGSGGNRHPAVVYRQ